MKKKLNFVILAACFIILCSTAIAAATPITSVSLTGVPDPVAGKHPSDFSSASIKTGSGSHYSVMEIAEWADKNAGPMSPADTFQSGHSYYVNILLKADTGYAFPFNSMTPGFTVRINGKEGHVDPEFEDAAIVNVWLEMAEGEKTSTYVEPSAPGTPSATETDGSSASKPDSTAPTSGTTKPTSGTTPDAAKKDNPLKVTVKKMTVKAGKKKVSIAAKNAFVISNAQGAVSYAKQGGDKALSISKTGKITIAKNTKKGTHKMKVVVTAAGNGQYKPVSKTVTVKVKVK